MKNNPCPSCGGKLAFSAERQMLACDYCGYTEDFVRENDKVVERELESTLLQARGFVPAEVEEKMLHCDGCGANVMIATNTVQHECPFCASKQINTAAFEQNFIQPSGILPFQIPKKQAGEAFKKWIAKGWFHPSKLKKMATLEELNGIYIPFWTFDAQTDSEWSGESGEYYYETVVVSENETREEQRTRWTWREGSLSHFFDDVLVPSTKGVNNPKFQRILTSYRLDEVVNFDSRLILGWRAEIYNLPLEKGFEIAKKDMDARIKGMCVSRLGGDTYRNLSIKTERSNETFKHIMLPLWVAAYRYNNKSYQFVINGQTGRIGGEKPLSWLRIAFAVLLAAALLAAIFFWAERTT